MSDHYRTIAGPAEARLKISRSEFLGLVIPVSSDEQFFDALAGIEKTHFDATHHCWAFRLFAGGRSRSSDAGEPSGTAGKPILSVIEGADLHDIGVVVVRWFGGVKLGTGGLSRAYRAAAAEALGGAMVIDRYVYERFVVIVPFDVLGTAYRLVDPPAAVLVSETFADRNEFTFDVRASRAEEFARMLTERRLAFHR